MLGIELKNLPTNYEDDKCLLQYSDCFLSLFSFEMSASHWTILYHINIILKLCYEKKHYQLTNLCVCVCVCTVDKERTVVRDIYY